MARVVVYRMNVRFNHVTFHRKCYLMKVMNVRFNHVTSHRKCYLMKHTPNNNNDTVLTLHTVFFVVVQAVLTPAVHVEAAAHVVQGAPPEVEKRSLGLFFSYRFDWAKPKIDL